MPEGPGRRGRLSVVSTPIGNLEDISLRAIRILKEADLILAEDTQRTKKLCAHHDIATRLRSFHAHSSPSLRERLLRRLAEGGHLALVSDAGTPLISDPGATLLRDAAKMGVELETVPGPSAVTAALTVSGIAFDDFRFLGFLPRGGKRRRLLLEDIGRERGACVLFESPLRIGRTLAELAGHLGPERTVAVCRELTKLHEEVVRGSARELAERFRAGTRGEITLVIEGAAPARNTPQAPDLDLRIVECLESGMTARDVARILSEESSLPRKAVYARVLRIKDGRFDP